MDFDDLDPRLRKPGAGSKIIEFEDDFEDSEPVQPQPRMKAKPVNVNPLRKYFRVPGISVTLPSGGYWYKNDEVNFNITNEVDVFPMTAGDELNLKNPDALLNGKAIELLIESCVPQVNNVRSMLAPDVDTLLIAIRAATNGGQMKVDLLCPKCGTTNELSADVASILHQQPKLEPPYSVIYQDLVVFIKPYNFAAQIKAAITAFDATKQIQQKTNRDQARIEENEELSKLLAENIKKITDIKFDLLLDTITHIVCNYNHKDQTGDVVTDKKYIREFLTNVHKKVVDQIQAEVTKINELVSARKELDVKCASCGHEWTGSIDFNPSSFFD